MGGVRCATEAKGVGGHSTRLLASQEDSVLPRLVGQVECLCAASLEDSLSVVAVVLNVRDLVSNTRFGETNHSFLDTAREEHDPDGTTEALGREVASELGSDGSAVSVMTSDLSPDSSELGSTLLRLGLVDISNPLSQVE